jgi:protease II
MAAPIARTEVVRDTSFGVTVEDAYRWLEDAGSDEVRGWPEGQAERRPERSAAWSPTEAR